MQLGLTSSTTETQGLESALKLASPPSLLREPNAAVPIEADLALIGKKAAIGENLASSRTPGLRHESDGSWDPAESSSSFTESAEFVVKKLRIIGISPDLTEHSVSLVVSVGEVL